MAPPGQLAISMTLILGLARGPAVESTPQPPAPDSDPVETPGQDAGEPGSEPQGPTPLEGAPDSADPDAPAPADAAAQTPEPGAPPAANPALAEPEPAPAQPVPPPDDPLEGAEEGDAGGEDWAEDEEDWAEDEEDWDDDYDPLRDSPEALQSQRRIAGGAVLIGLGALTAIGGLAMAVSDPCATPAGNSCSTNARNRAALAMALPGLAVLGTGITVLTLGTRQRNALRVDASASRRGGVLAVSGRF